MNPWDAPRLAGNNKEPVVIEPDDVEQQNDAPDEHMQPPIHAENRAGNNVQQPINNEDVDVPPDVDPLPDNVDYWVRRSTCLGRQVNRYDTLIHYIMLSDEGEPLTYKEAKLYEHKKK